MKTALRYPMNVLLVTLLMAASLLTVQANDAAPGDSTKSSFDVGMYMGAQWTVNLLLAVHQPTGVTITVKDSKNIVLYRQFLRRSRISYRQKIKFDGCETGVYLIEISDGQQTIVRRIEVVDLPAVEPQRYITYGPQTSL